MKKIFLIILLHCCIHTQSQNSYPKDYFSSPINMKIAIAGTFGELRNNHFHSGIDIKTRQKKNIPIYASADGYIARIKVSSFGFGKAIYINHDNGFSTVYAHLESFNDTLNHYTINKQYEKEQFEVDLIMKENMFTIQKGELIGLSGNTGSSTAPHLHFEIRNTSTQDVINPMLFNFPILDTQSPIIDAILIYHEDHTQELIKSHKLKKGEYSIDSELNINNSFNIAIKTYDLLDAAPNKNGIYNIQLYVNDSLQFENQMETFSFTETKLINSHIDYGFYQKNNQKFQKLFLDQNNNISTNKKNTDLSIGKNLKPGKHTLKIIVEDSYHNSSELVVKFNLNLTESNQQTLSSNDIINSKRVFNFNHKDFDLYIPEMSLYKDHIFTYQIEYDTIFNYPILDILDSTIPSHKTSIISIKLASLAKHLRPKAIITKIDNETSKYVNSKWAGDKIIGKIKEFGKFTISIDTIKPEIKIKKKLTDDIMEFTISDTLSGIKTYRGEINGQWILMEYDYKTNILRYSFTTPKQNKKQTFKLIVEDRVGNKQELLFDFIR